MSDGSEIYLKTTAGGGIATFFSGFLSYQELIPMFVSVGGLLITFMSFCIMWRYKYLENRRAEELHAFDLLERRKHIKEDTGERRRVTDDTNDKMH